MIPNRPLLLVLVVCAAAGSSAAPAQPSAPPATGEPAATADVDEEVLVIGRSYGAIRQQILEAEEALYARFNAINSDDEFDISCRREAPTGSRILRRVCRPNFWYETEADYAQLTMRGDLGSAQMARAQQLHKGGLLVDEMRRLAVEDEELFQSAVRIASLREALSERQRAPRPAATTVARQVSAGDAPLPYDAELMVEVQIGRQPWQHRFTRRTFTIAHLYGEIRALEIECEQETERLEHEVGIEWTVPEGWGSCALTVDAKRGTTFALYEFQ